MAKYLVQVAYTPESWAAMTKHPQNRIDMIRPAVEKLGGRIDDGYLCFGEYDLVTIVDFPDNVSSAAFALAVGSTGSCKAYKTTPLMTMSEAVQAMEKASDTGYTPPK